MKRTAEAGGIVSTMQFIRFLYTKHEGSEKNERVKNFSLESACSFSLCKVRDNLSPCYPLVDPSRPGLTDEWSCCSSCKQEDRCTIATQVTPGERIFARLDLPL